MKSSRVLVILLVFLGFSIARANLVTAADQVHWTLTGQTAVTFDWRGTKDENVIRYGTSSGNYTHKVIASACVPDPLSGNGPYWEAKINGLQENTLYHYSIAGGAEHTFRTPPVRGSSGFTVCAESDMGSTIDHPIFSTTQQMIADIAPEFVLVCGDLTHEDRNGAPAVDQHFIDVMVWSQDAAYMPIWGNHDWDSKIDYLSNYKGRFDLPNSHNEDWYWFDYGNVRFIAYPEPYGDARDTWWSSVEQIMAEAQNDPAIRFIVTFGHRPAYSSGYHDGASNVKEYLDTLGDAYSKYVLNLNGHSHDYERSFPQHGVTHITVATSGGDDLAQKNSCLWGTCSQPAWSAFRAMHLGVFKLDFGPAGIQGSFICGPPGGGDNDVTCTQGSVLDSFSIGSFSNEDVTPPTVSITTPAYGSEVAGKIDISAVASDNERVSSVQFLLDGQNLGSKMTSVPYSISWDTTNVADGQHTLAALARDAAGNIGNSETVQVTVTNNSTATTLTFIPTDDATIESGSASSNFGSASKIEVDDSPKQQMLIRFSVSGVGGRTVRDARLRLYNVNASDRGGDFYRVSDNDWNEQTVTWSSAPAADAAPIASLGPVSRDSWVEVDVSPLVTGDGIYSMRVDSTSRNGASYSSKETGTHAPELVVSVGSGSTADTTPPEVSVTTPGSGDVISGTANLAVAASDDVGVTGVQFLLDGRNLGIEVTSTPYAISWDTIEITDGSHTIAAVARDAAGNTATSPAVTVSVKNSVDAGSQTVSISAPIDGATVAGKVTVQADVAGSDGVTAVQFQVDGENLGAEITSAPFVISWDSTAVDNGYHVISAVVRDPFGTSAIADPVTVSVENSSSGSTLLFSPIDDATIEADSPTSNFGSKSKIEVDDRPEQQFLLKFSVSGIGNRQVQSAILRLYVANASDFGGDFYKVSDNNWSQQTVTWNNAPPADSTCIASLGSVARDNWVEIDVTSLITGDGTYSLRAISTSRNGAGYKAMDAGANSPELLVTLH